MVLGINQEVNSDQFVPNFLGGNIEIVSDQFTPNFTGVSFDGEIDLVVCVEDINGVSIINPTFTLTNSISNNTVTEGVNGVLLLAINKDDNFDISAIAPGYQEKSINVAFSEDQPVRLKIILEEIEKIEFNCDTIFLNVNGDEIQEDIVPSNGSINIVFSSDSDFDYNDYLFFPESVRFDGDKYSPVDLNYNVKSFTNNSVTFEVENTGDSVCFISNFVKKC